MEDNVADRNVDQVVEVKQVLDEHAIRRRELLKDSAKIAAAAPATDLPVMLWVLAGFLTMFFIERFFCFHHHEVEDGEVSCHHQHDADGHHSHGHDVTGIGAAIPNRFGA